MASPGPSRARGLFGLWFGPGGWRPGTRPEAGIFKFQVFKFVGIPRTSVFRQKKMMIRPEGAMGKDRCGLEHAPRSLRPASAGGPVRRIFSGSVSPRPNLSVRLSGRWVSRKSHHKHATTRDTHAPPPRVCCAAPRRAAARVSAPRRRAASGTRTRIAMTASNGSCVSVTGTGTAATYASRSGAIT